MCKIIFLDVDGVLNSETYLKSKGMKGLVADVDPKACELLKILVQHTGADIVLSSSWRISKKQTEMLSEKLAEYGLKIADATPHLGIERGKEIGEWLDRHPDVQRFVILDDDSDMEDLSDHLVQTTWKSGLRYTHVLKAYQLLTCG